MDIYIPDGKNWHLHVTHCHKWIRETWPDLPEAKIGEPNPDECWCAITTLSGVIYHFTDPAKALMFKLACGGNHYDS